MRKLTVMRVCLLIFYVLMFSVAFTSCSKDDGGKPDTSKDYYFKASLDGRAIVFHTVNFQGSETDGRWEHIVIGGHETSEVTSPSLDFELWRVGGNITAGTYVTTTESEMISRYAIQQSNGTLLYNTSYFDDEFTVKIETISKEGIKGTFSGTLRNLAGVAINVTDGSFNLPYETLVNP